jgi:hypothetical protein
MALELPSGFEIIYCSDVDYEEMTVEILYRNQQVMQINKDMGIYCMEASLYNQHVIQGMERDLTFGLDDFSEAMLRAREMLAGSNILSSEATSTSTFNDFHIGIIPTRENEDATISVTYNETTIAQITNNRKLGRIDLHVPTEFVKAELLSETKFPLGDFIKVLRQAKEIYF